nr:uncharacterized protein LOC111504309 [Leptinotarsa decemlineata]
MNQSRILFEEYPLKKSSIYKRNTRKESSRLPLKVARLCFLGILLPCVLLSVPLYMRYRVYGLQLYPLAVSDMRMLDSKVSTTWCQRQLVKVNATFNAFLMSNNPQILATKKPLSMMRELDLEDDTKEYWGFYLLKGTSVTVSTCVRWPGASLIVIRGHKHLHECAYIGDDSSEELDELMEAVREGVYVDIHENRPPNSTKSDNDEAPANDPELMRRHRPEVEFLSPIHRNASRSHHLAYAEDNSEISDTKDLKQILDALHVKSATYRKKLSGKSHTHRNSTIAKGESQNMHIEAPEPNNSSQEILSDILRRLKALGPKGPKILQKVNVEFDHIGDSKQEAIDMRARHYSKPSVNFGDYIDQARRRKRDLILSTAMGMNENDEENDHAMEEGLTPDGIADHRGTINETTLNDMSNSEFWSSFSSSEEALLNCAGLILNLPLMPHHRCIRGLSEKDSYQDNTITYRVPTNGYYFFVFNSENEVVTNYVRVHFEIEKTVYNVSNPVAYCVNKSTSCSIDLDFFSSEKLVMELPVNGNESLWNEEYIVVSECEPRTAVYAVFILLVPIMVGLFAFS